MNISKKESVKGIVKYLNTRLADIIDGFTDEQLERLCEIRIREEQPVILIFTTANYFITGGGRLTQIYSGNVIKMNRSEIEKIFSKMCKYSVYSQTESIANGFITLENGSRVGVYGTAVSENGRVVSVRNVSGLNIRLSGELTDVSRPIAERFFNDKIGNTLICGPPLSGKTTVLRDLCRILSNEKQKKIAVVDERGEMYGYNLGFNTDVLNRYPKSVGIEIAVRTLSPEIVVCDEIGELQEVKAVVNSLNSGVKFIMSVHCRDIDELKNKEQFKFLKEAQAVENYVFLDRNFHIEMRSEDENCRTDNAGNCLRVYGSVHSVLT